jgi:hypothetical protein
MVVQVWVSLHLQIGKMAVTQPVRVLQMAKATKVKPGRAIKNNWRND